MKGENAKDPPPSHSPSRSDPVLLESVQPLPLRARETGRNLCNDEFVPLFLHF